MDYEPHYLNLEDPSEDLADFLNNLNISNEDSLPFDPLSAVSPHFFLFQNVMDAVSGSLPVVRLSAQVIH